MKAYFEKTVDHLVWLLTALMFTSAAVSAEPANRGTQSLGRLFFTPERRAVLEYQRRQNIQDAPLVEGTTLNIDGVVRNSSGRATTWVNGIAHHNNDAGTGMHIRLSAQDPSQVTLSADEDAPLRARVGQSVNRATGETKDGLSGGRIVVKRKASTP